MVAPGDCSPSRKVVSKITTRSFSDRGCEDMRIFLLTKMAAKTAPPSALFPFPVLVSRSHPLSAQAHAPSRPSGASKEQRQNNKGGAGTGGSPPVDRANFAAHRHAKTLVVDLEGRENW